MENGTRLLSSLLDDLDQSNASEENQRRTTADPASIEAVLSSLLSNISQDTPEESYVQSPSRRLSGSRNKENRSTSNMSTPSSLSPLSAVSTATKSSKSSKSKLNARRTTADAADIESLIRDLQADNSLNESSMVPSTRSSLSTASSVPLCSERKKENRRTTADAADVQSLLRGLQEESVDVSSLASLSGLQSSMESEDIDDADIVSYRRMTADPEDVLSLLNNTISPSNTSDSGGGRRKTARYSDIAALLEKENSRDVSSRESIDTLGLIGAMEDLLASKDEKLTEQRVTNKHQEQLSVSPSLRRSRRLSIQSPTALLNTSVIAEFDFQSAQRLVSKNPPPVVVLKSCIGGIKPPMTPGSAVKRVVFGSPNVMEFRKNAVPGTFTPLSPQSARKLYRDFEPALIEETEDQVTAENSRILEEWDRLSNASGYNSEEDDAVAVPVMSSPRIKRRKSSMRSPVSYRVHLVPDAEDNDNNTCTINLPVSLLALMMESLKPHPQLALVSQDMSVAEGSFNSSLLSEHTRDLELDLHSLLRTIAPAPISSPKSPETSSPVGLADCNKSWIDFSHVSSRSSSSSDHCLAPLLGLQDESKDEDFPNQVSDVSSKISYHMDIPSGSKAPAAGFPTGRLPLSPQSDVVFANALCAEERSPIGNSVEDYSLSHDSLERSVYEDCLMHASPVSIHSASKQGISSPVKVCLFLFGAHIFCNRIFCEALFS